MKKIATTLILLLSSLFLYANVDTVVGINTPSFKDYKQLTHNICDGLNTDMLKANAIYNWITHHIDYDIQKSKDPLREKEKPENVFRNSKTTTDGYALLFVAMCHEAGLKAVVIDGYAKDWVFDNGDKIYLPRHSWAAVMINERWELTDVLLGTGYIDRYDGWLQQMLHNMFSKSELHYGSKEHFVFHYNPAFFMQHPLAFRFIHAPSDPLWQLTSSPMPISVFEMGDTAIMQYNEMHTQLTKNHAALLHIANMEEPEKIVDYAERAAEYNTRNVYILALKEQIQAVYALSQNNSNEAVAKRALAMFKKATEYLNDQKKTFAPHYTELTRKNTAKNREAKDHLRQIRSDNKLHQMECDRYKEATQKNTAKLNEKEDIAKKRQDDLSINNLNYVITNSIEKKSGDPMLQKLVDSVSARKNRIKAINTVIAKQTNELEASNNENLQRKADLLKALQSADTIIAYEAAERIMLRDNYDDPVKKYSGLYKKIKFGDADTLHKYYIITYDTINDRQERLIKTYLSALDMYKNNIKDIEQYKKNNNTEKILTNDYERTVNGYVSLLQNYLQMLASFRGYETQNASLFKDISELYKHEDDVLDKMDKAEEARFNMEAKTLIENRSFDEHENENMKNIINKNIAEIERQMQS